MKNLAWHSILSTAVLLLAACGGGTPTNNVARVVIEQESVLLTGVGKTQTLTAKAYDASGNPVQANITFSSSKPQVVAISGNTVSGVAVGSSQIVASVGQVKSRPVLAAVATLTSDTADIAQSNIVEGPNFIGLSEGEVPSVGSRYTAVVRNLSPAVGAKWFSQGVNGQRLQGRVVEVVDAPGGNKQVTIEVAPLEDIFAQLDINEEIDFSNATDRVPPAVVEQGLSSMVFVGFGALECELSNVGASPPITLGIPTMSIRFSTDTARTGIQVRVGFGQDNVVEVRFRGTLNAAVNLSGSINRNFSGSVDCRAKEPIVSSITGIPLPLFTSLNFERGLGVKFSGDFSGPTTRFSAGGSLAITLDIGARVNLNNQTITPFNTVSFSGDALLRITEPNQITTFSTNAEAYVFSNWVLRVPGLSFDLWQDRTALRSVANMVSVPQQITSGTSTTYRLERAYRQGPGPEFRAFLRFFNATELIPQTQSSTTVIRPAPFTLGSFGCSALTGSTSRARCSASFSQRDFPVAGDNILKLEIWARRGSGTPFRAAENTNVSASVILTNTSADTTLQAGDQCFLVVYTKTLPFAGIVAGNPDTCL